MWKVLLIDDEEITHFINEKIMNHVGFSIEVRRAYSVDEGLEVLSNWKPDIIFLDIRMPKKDGLDFLVSFSSLDTVSTSGIKIVMLTSSLDQKEQEKAKSYDSVVSYLNKPLDVDKLESLMAQFSN